MTNHSAIDIDLAKKTAFQAATVIHNMTILCHWTVRKVFDVDNSGGETGRSLNSLTKSFYAFLTEDRTDMAPFDLRAQALTAAVDEAAAWMKRENSLKSPTTEKRNLQEACKKLMGCTALVQGAEAFLHVMLEADVAPKAGVDTANKTRKMGS